MRNFYQGLIITISLMFTAGCQTTPTVENIFQPQTKDVSVTTAVLEAMLLVENISTLNIHVETVNGVVLLSGYVKTIRQSDTAEDVAKKTPGVKSVQNNIIVRK